VGHHRQQTVKVHVRSDRNAGAEPVQLATGNEAYTSPSIGSIPHTDGLTDERRYALKIDASPSDCTPKAAARPPLRLVAGEGRS